VPRQIRDDPGDSSAFRLGVFQDVDAGGH
jgi:hypothetical protein